LTPDIGALSQQLPDDSCFAQFDSATNVDEIFGWNSDYLDPSET